MQLEIVSHCWNYSRLLTYQLSSLVLHPPKDCTVKATIFHSVEDAETVQTLEWFAGRQVERVEWNFLSLPPKQLMRRAIGRNIAALASKADAVLFSDCDYAFGDGALDQIAVTLQQQFVTGDKICWPEWVMQSKLHKHGDAEVQRVESPGLYEVDAHRYKPMRIPVAIGGCQWVPGEFCRARGYIPESRTFQKPVKRWKRTVCDQAFRSMTGLLLMPVHINNIYRIRHSERGWQTEGLKL